LDQPHTVFLVSVGDALEADRVGIGARKLVDDGQRYADQTCSLFNRIPSVWRCDDEFA